MSAEEDRLPRKCGDGEPDGCGCGLFFKVDQRAAYVEHRTICTRWRLRYAPVGHQERPVTRRDVTYGS